jgi:hypothetical protein
VLGILDMVVARMRSSWLALDQAGAQHSQSPVIAEGGAVMPLLDARYVREST